MYLEQTQSPFQHSWNLMNKQRTILHDGISYALTPKQRRGGRPSIVKFILFYRRAICVLRFTRLTTNKGGCGCPGIITFSFKL